MRWYKFGEPSGRYVGETAYHRITENMITEKTETLTEKYKELPGEFGFLYGPSTGGLLESVLFNIHTPGEVIKGIDVNPEVKLRKIIVNGLKPADALLRIERINAYHSASHSIAFCSAVEDALDKEVSETTRERRIAMIELERIRSNLEVIKRICEPAGFGVPYNQIAYLKEKISRIIGNLFDHRYMFSSNSIGFATLNFKDVSGELSEIRKDFSDIFDSLLQSKIFLNRLQNNGVIDTADLIGPAARAAGHNIDARIDSETLPYRDMNFKPAIFDEPDAFGRFYVRSMEVLDSIDLVMSIKLETQQEKSNDPKNSEGEGAARIESPQGDLFYYVKIFDGKIDHIELSSPSIPNINAFKKSMIGNIFTDFHFNWESFGIWISEAAVLFQ